ncbi:MAG TPA: hypothetical protein VIW29_15490, partial [Polyangiaceae bacterium]
MRSSGPLQALVSCVALLSIGLGGCSNADAGDDVGKGGKSAVGEPNGGSGGKSSAGTGAGTSAGTNPGTNAGSPGSGGSPVVPNGVSSAADVARKLGRPANFLIGLGNDLPGDFKWENASVYSVGAKLDLHYIYLAYGWKDWNAGGYFAQTIAKEDLKHDVVPMATVYGMAGQGEARLDV